MPFWYIFAALVITGLAPVTTAGSLKCKATLYRKQNFASDNVNITLSPQGGADKLVITDLAELTPKPAPGATWNSTVNSVVLMCSCTAGNCTADYPKVILRIFAEPKGLKHMVGNRIDVNCTSYSSPKTCTGALAWMPAGWGTGGVALLYNVPDFRLPGTEPAASKKPGAKPGSRRLAPGQDVSRRRRRGLAAQRTRLRNMRQ